MSNVHGMVRSAYMFDTDAVSNETALDTGEDAFTQQCFKDECDINILLAKFAVTGQLPENVRVPQFVDFEETFDFLICKEERKPFNRNTNTLRHDIITTYCTNFCTFNIAHISIV